MILSPKCGYGQSLSFVRSFSSNSSIECNHYKVLGINSSATQAEIKSAFYELSKKHHPDKNQGCEKSARKFKDIMAAYTVLKDKKLRKQYDAELFQSNRNEDSNFSRYKMDYNDEDEKYFYRKTMKIKTKRYYGKTVYYDFDAWYKAHYSSPYTFKTYDNMSWSHYKVTRNKNIRKTRSNVFFTQFIIGTTILLISSIVFQIKK